MIARDVVGELNRRGRPDAERLDRALGGGAGSFGDGPLAVAWTGPDAARDDRGGFALIDGGLDRDPVTDAEVAPADPQAAVLEAWRGRGDTLLDALRGDFAVVLWDGAAGLLVRDQIGARGLYWHDDGARLRFASEPHLLLRLLATRPGPDRFALAHWITVSGMPGDRTLYDTVRRVPAAHSLALDPRAAQPAQRYWRLEPSEPELRPRTEHVERWREALSTAVARRCGAPGETALLLSGGIDSSSVGALVPAERRPQRAYSAVFPDHPSVDESALIAELTEALGLQSVRIEVRAGSVLEGALPYLERWELPPVSPNLFFWNPLMQRAAADGTRVLLDGEGGDELLGMVAPYIADRLAARDPLGALGLVYRVPGAFGRPPLRSVARVLLHGGVRPLAPAWVHAASRRMRPPERYGVPWLRPDLARAYVASTDGAAYKRIAGPRWWGWLVDTMLTGVGPQLAYDHIRHRSAMAGIAARHPIMDVDVVQTVLATPPDFSFDPFVTRPLLREATAGRLPESVRTRVGKSTFDAVFHEALAGPDLPLMRALLARGARCGEYVDLERVRTDLLERVPTAGPGRIMWGVQLWRLANIECWLRYQEDPGAPRAALEGLGMPAPDVTLAG